MTDRNTPSKQGSTELYYAEMEAARNTAEAAYFTARPLLNEGPPVETFRAGFERAFRLLWKPTAPETPIHRDPTGSTREPPHCPSCSCGAPVEISARPHIVVLAEHFAAVVRDFDARIGSGLRSEYTSPICVRRDVVEAMRAALKTGSAQGDES